MRQRRCLSPAKDPRRPFFGRRAGPTALSRGGEGEDAFARLTPRRVDGRGGEHTPSSR